MNEPRLETLANLFPECVVNDVDENGNQTRRIEPDLLVCAIQRLQGARIGEERYAFTWQGKKEAAFASTSATGKGLVPCKEESVFWDKTKNLYIEGDNLDALKLLRTDWKGRIKVVYIDPPYNSGNDFVYHDDFRIRNNDRRSSVQSEQDRLHSAWCSMFYARALVARELISDDGIMLVSIDDRELSNALKILDEIFGESSRLATLVWKTKNAAIGMPPASMCVRNHEYVLAYGKGPSSRFKGERRSAADGFANPDGDPRGPWKRQYLQRFGQGFPVRTIVDPATGIAYTFETPYTETKMVKLVQEGRIIFPTEPNKYPLRKEFFAEYANKNKPILTFLGYYSTKVGSEELKKLFGGVKVFDYPKPLALMIDLLRQTLGKSGVVLDFFSGSGTTGNAVMALNAADGGSRRFICVQSAEKCAPNSVASKAGFATVSVVGKERLRLAGMKIMKEKTDARKFPDVGFRVYKIADAI